MYETRLTASDLFWLQYEMTPHHNSVTKMWKNLDIFMLKSDFKNNFNAL